MTTQFSALTEATARNDTDEIAIARGAATLRMALSVLIDGLGPETAAQILAKLLTVDGAGSGLDADLLDGMTPAQVAALGGGGSSAYYPIDNANVGGTANAITLTTGQTLTALTGGMLFFFNSTNTNTGATTINVDGIGTRNLQRSRPRGEGANINTGSEALEGGEITNSDPVMVVYGSQFNEFYLLPSRAGTAAYRNIGNAEFDVPSLGSGGRLALARLGSGTPSATNFLRGDGAWETPAGGGTADGVLDGATLALTAAGVLSGIFSRSVGADVASNDLNVGTVLALLTGATFTGEVSGVTPTVDAHFATKEYVDSMAGGGGASSFADLTGEIADGQVPATFTRDVELAAYAALSGATFTNEVQGVTPTNDAGFTTKAYVDAAVAGTTPPTPQQEQIFYGQIGSAAEAATVDVSTLTAEDATVAGHDFSIGPSVDGQFFVILVPANHDLLTLVNTHFNTNVLSTYVRATNVRQLGTPAENYNAYTHGPLNAGLSVSYRATLTE